MATTTGNITGIYDMAGGSWKYVMGDYLNIEGSSGFSIYSSDKHYEIYSDNQNILGKALFETDEWHEDSKSKSTLTYSWFERGGYVKTSYNVLLF